MSQLASCLPPTATPQFHCASVQVRNYSLPLFCFPCTGQRSGSGVHWAGLLQLWSIWNSYCCQISIHYYHVIAFKIHYETFLWPSCVACSGWLLWLWTLLCHQLSAGMGLVKHLFLSALHASWYWLCPSDMDAVGNHQETLTLCFSAHQRASRATQGSC